MTMGDTNLLAVLGILREGGLAVIYLGGAITCLVLGLRKAGVSAWLGLGAFGLLLCNVVLGLAVTFLLPQARALPWSLVTVVQVQSCCGAGLAAVAALLLIASLVMAARQRTTTPPA
jgi:hypothetical protein